MPLAVFTYGLASVPVKHKTKRFSMTRFYIENQVYTGIVKLAVMQQKTTKHISSLSG